MGRYVRNIQLDLIGEAGQKKLSSMKVAVIGAGGTASSVLFGLAGLGVKNITILDGDILEESNFNRQFVHPYYNKGVNKALSAKETLLIFNPDLDLIAVPGYLTEDNLSLLENADFVFCCVDTISSSNLVDSACKSLGKDFIFSSLFVPNRFMGEVIYVLAGSETRLSSLYGKRKDGTAPKGSALPVVAMLGNTMVITFLKAVLTDMLPNNAISTTVIDCACGFMSSKVLT